MGFRVQDTRGRWNVSRGFRVRWCPEEMAAGDFRVQGAFGGDGGRDFRVQGRPEEMVGGISEYKGRPEEMAAEEYETHGELTHDEDKQEQEWSDGWGHWHVG